MCRRHPSSHAVAYDETNRDSVFAGRSCCGRAIELRRARVGRIGCVPGPQARSGQATRRRTRRGSGSACENIGDGSRRSGAKLEAWDVEPKRMHGKRQIVEPDRLLTADEIAERVCASFGYLHEPHLSHDEEVSLLDPRSVLRQGSLSPCAVHSTSGEDGAAHQQSVRARCRASRPLRVPKAPACTESTRRRRAD